MKLKLDENVGRSVQRALQQLGYDADTVQDEGLAGALDEQVLTKAQEEQRFVITFDQDFADLARTRVHGGILRIRLKPEEQIHAAAYVSRWFADRNLIKAWAGKLVIASASKIRIR